MNKAERKKPARRGWLKQLRSSSRLHHLGIIVLGSGLVLLACIMAISPTRYSLTVGMVPHVTIAATRDVIDEVTTEQNKALAAAAVTPTYKHQEGITEEVMTAFDNVAAQLSAVRQYAQTLPDYDANRRYDEEELGYAAQMLPLVSLRDYQLVTLMSAPQLQFDELISSLKTALRNTMQGYVTQGQESIAINSIMQIVGFKTSVSLLQNVALPSLKAVVKPNMVIDQEQTDAARQAAMAAVEPVVYKQGQNIVARGEGRTRSNQIAMLNSLGLLQNNRTDGRLYWGAVLAVSLSLLMMILLLQAVCPELLESSKRLALVYLVLLGITLMSYLAKTLQGVYFAPVILGAMLLSIMLGYKEGLIVNACAALISSLILGLSGGANQLDLVSVLVANLLAGGVAALLLYRNDQRMMIFVVGAAAALVSFLSVLALGLMNSNATANYVEKALYAAGGAGLASALCLALQPLLESLFNLPTNNRLLELSNPNHPLLRRLLLEAPGTYHHSILISNLAEASAEAVGANPLLARVGGYYHDIGKLKRPLYFKENQIGAGNVHDNTDPSVSAAIITSHTRDGIALAKQYRLPYEVQEIIGQHHGNSRVAYFYSKALKEAKEAVDDESFRYDGQPPTSAEASIVMLCDTIEAAVRSLSNPTPEEIDAFIAKLIKAKQDEGQLINSPLSLRDLQSIQQSCGKIIHGIFHERIEYPAQDRVSAIEKVIQNLRSGSKRPTAPTEAPADKP